MLGSPRKNILRVSETHQTIKDSLLKKLNLSKGLSCNSFGSMPKLFFAFGHINKMWMGLNSCCCRMEPERSFKALVLVQKSLINSKQFEQESSTKISY